MWISVTFSMCNFLDIDWSCTSFMSTSGTHFFNEVSFVLKKFVKIVFQLRNKVCLTDFLFYLWNVNFFIPP